MPLVLSMMVSVYIFYPLLEGNILLWILKCVLLKPVKDGVIQMLHVKCKGELLSFSSHCSIFVLIDKSYEKTKILLNIFFHFHLACLALQTENIVQKITQPIFVFGNFVNQDKTKRKMG